MIVDFCHRNSESYNGPKYTGPRTDQKEASVARSLDSRIGDLKTKLEKKQMEISDIKAQIKELEVEKQADLLAKVTEVAAQKGVSVEDLLAAAMN